MTYALEVDDLSVTYGGVRAVRRISLFLRPGELVAVIGANGAGKTTTLNAIMGLVPSTCAAVRLFGRDVRPLASFQRVQQGLTLVPEGRGTLARMTVTENLQIGRIALGPKARTQEREDLQRAFDLFPRLADRAGQLAGTLSGGEQQMLALARALMCRPRLLMLDEPSMGLAPKMITTIFEVIADVARSGVTILLVEQNAALALEVAQRAYVMDSGEITLHGGARHMARDRRIRESYLGE